MVGIKEKYNESYYQEIMDEAVGLDADMIKRRYLLRLKNQRRYHSNNWRAGERIGNESFMKIAKENGKAVWKATKHLESFVRVCEYEMYRKYAGETEEELQAILYERAGRY